MSDITVSPAKPSMDKALHIFELFFGEQDVLPCHLFGFLYIATRGPVLVSELGSQSWSYGSVAEDIVSFLRREKVDGSESNSVINVFASIDGRNKWVSLNTQGRELYRHILSSISSQQLTA